MQDNTLTLPVDAANNATVVNEVYRRFSESDGRSLYIGTDHTDGERNTLTLLRTLPKANGNFKGVGKATFKFTQDIHVPSGTQDVDVLAPAIVEVSFSLPVGATPAIAMHLRQRALAMLDKDSYVANLHELRET